MRFAYIDSQGKEVSIPSIDALRLRIELKAIVEDTMFHDANSGKWAPAGEHEIFRTLQRELEELEAGSFTPPPLPEEPESGPEPEAGAELESEAEPAAELEPGPEPEVESGPEADPSAPLDGGGSKPDVPVARPAEDGDDFGLGVTLDLVPEDDMEPEAAELDETAAAGAAGSALEGLEGFELASDWGQEEEGDAEDADRAPDDPGVPPEPEAAPASEELPEEPATPVADDGPAAQGPPERFAMSPQDDLMASVPDPGHEDADEDRQDADVGGGLGGELDLEPGLAESFEADALSAGTAASDDLALERPLTDYDADQPPSWMDGDADDDAPVPSFAEEAEVPPAPDRGEPPPRPSARPRSAPPQRKLRRAGTPGVGRLVGVLAAAAVVALGGWYGYRSFVGPSGDGGAGVTVRLPEIPSELEPRMRELADGAAAGMVAAVAALPERDAIPARPDSEWLTGRYLAGASGFDGVPAYWQAVLDYLGAVEAAAPEAFRTALDGQLSGAGLSADEEALIRERALAGWEAAAGDRQRVYDQLRAVGGAALDLHRFVVANEGQITYAPATGGVSRDPVLEAVPDTEELGDAMWSRVGDVTRSLDELGYLETVTTDGLLQTFLDRLEAVPVP